MVTWTELVVDFALDKRLEMLVNVAEFMGSRWQHCAALMRLCGFQQLIQIKCFSGDWSCQPCGELSSWKKGVPSGHILFDDAFAAKHLFHFGNVFPCWPNISHAASADDRIWGRGKWDFYSVEGHMLRERKHMPLFLFAMNLFSFESKRVAHGRLPVDLLHTQWWLSAKQWGTEIDMLLRLVHIHPSITQSHLGRLVLPASADMRPMLTKTENPECRQWISN